MRRLLIFMFSGACVVFMAGVLSAHTAGIVVPPSYAGVTHVAVHFTPPPSLFQREPFGGTVSSTSGDDRFKDYLKVVRSRGDVTFVVTSPNPSLRVSSNGEVTIVGGPLAIGEYLVSGTDSTAAHETGTWSYTLTVSANSGDNSHGDR